MAESQQQISKLRVGIVGLGRRWRRRYRPALHALRDRFVIRAVSDARYDRADREARKLRCPATAVVEMLERKDLDALLLLDSAWHGLWPLQAACRFRKPVFCAVPLDSDPEHADAVCLNVSAAKLPVMPVLLPRVAPATIRLQRLLDAELGTPRLLLCEHRGLKPGRIGVDLLDWCGLLFGVAPVRTRTSRDGPGTVEEFAADFGDGRSAIVRRWSGPLVRPAVQMRVVAERGTALVALPNRLWWNDADGRHAFTTTGQRPTAEVLLTRFHQAVTAGQAMQPGLEDACQDWRWLRCAKDASIPLEK